MAIYYLRSTDGTDTPGGTTWATAFATLQYAATQMAAGDTLYVSQVHVDSQTGTFTVSFPGTVDNPIKIICANDGAEPPTSVATTAQFGATYVAVTFTGYAYIYGLRTICRRWFQTSSTDSGIVLESGYIKYGEGSGGYIWTGSGGANHKLTLLNTDLEGGSGATNNYIFTYYAGVFEMHGGSITYPTLTTSLCRLHARGTSAFFKDVDLSSISSSLVTPMSSTEGLTRNIFERCNLHTSVTVIASPIVSELETVILHSCSSGNTTYEIHEEHYSGSIVEDTAIYRTSGASDGTTNQSWAMATIASKATTFSTHLISPPIAGWTDSTTSKTFTIEIAVDGSATPLQDDEIWMELEYPGSTAQGLKASDRVASELVTPVDQATSTEAWTGLGGTNVKQKLSATVTPGKVGPITARVHLATAGAVTVFVDPMITEA